MARSTMDTDAIVDLVMWPTDTLTLFGDPDARMRIQSTKRFIDFDGTITDDDGNPRDVLYGMPIQLFLAAGPFIVTTLNVAGARAYFAARPALSQPCLILAPPMRYIADVGAPCKDFASLGVTDALIVDDAIGLVYAPDCRVIGPDVLP